MVGKSDTGLQNDGFWMKHLDSLKNVIPQGQFQSMKSDYIKFIAVVQTKRDALQKFMDWGQKFQNNISDYHSTVDKFTAKERVVEKVYSQLIDSRDKIVESVKKSTTTSGKILEMFDPVENFENCYGCAIHCKPFFNSMKAPIGRKNVVRRPRKKIKNETTT